MGCHTTSPIPNILLDCLSAAIDTESNYVFNKVDGYIFIYISFYKYFANDCAIV